MEKFGKLSLLPPFIWSYAFPKILVVSKVLSLNGNIFYGGKIYLYLSVSCFCFGLLTLLFVVLNI